jgi:hypothetical protein
MTLRMLRAPTGADFTQGLGGFPVAQARPLPGRAGPVKVERPAGRISMSLSRLGGR